MQFNGFQTGVHDLLALGVRDSNELDPHELDYLLLCHFEDKKAVIDEAYLEEFLLESLAGQSVLVFDILSGDYQGIPKALRDYGCESSIVEELWDTEMQRLEDEYQRQEGEE